MVGYAHPETANTSATVNMTDAPAFTPRSVTASSGGTLSVHLVNQGNYNHSFTLSKVPNFVLSSSWSPAQLNSFFAKNGSLANVSVAPRSSAWANVTFNTSTGGDSFEFASVVPYQFQSGMWGFVNITSSGPGLQLMENTTDQYSFVPDVLSASPSHYPLVLNVLVTNTGNLGHTFTVSPLSNYTLSPANFTATFATNAPLVNQPIGSGAGTTAWANFTVRAPGVYQYICTISGHFANGMTGFLYVGVPVPPAPPVPSTAIVESWVLVGSGALLGIGVLVAIIASYAGRFPAKPGAKE
jgi:plastocyanin